MMTIEEVIDHHLPVGAFWRIPTIEASYSQERECKGKKVITLDKKIITLNFPKDEYTDGKFKYEIKVNRKSIKPQNGEAAFETLMKVLLLSSGQLMALKQSQSHTKPRGSITRPKARKISRKPTQATISLATLSLETGSKQPI